MAEISPEDVFDVKIVLDLFMTVVDTAKNTEISDAEFREKIVEKVAGFEFLIETGVIAPKLDPEVSQRLLDQLEEE